MNKKTETTPSQHWDPQSYEQNARFVSSLAGEVLRLLDPQSGERILDLGCGDGDLAVTLQNKGCVVVGVDSSAPMVERTRECGVEAYVMSGDALTFTGEFDAVFSNAALHWMTNATAVIEGVWNALKEGGRFVGEFGGAGNVQTIREALEARLRARGHEVPSPWFFPSPEEYRALLEQGGFEVRHIERVPRPTQLPGDVSDWIKTFAQPFLGSFPETEQSEVLAEVMDQVRDKLCDADGVWWADYVRVRFAAIKPSQG